jgi:hypothetical protein
MMEDPPPRRIPSLAIETMSPSAALSLDDIVGPTRVDVITKLVSPDDVTSPVSGLRAAFVHLEALERVRAHEGSGIQEELFSLGTIIIGDLVTLVLEGRATEVELQVRRAQLRFLSDHTHVLPIAETIPELVPLLGAAKHGGILCHRERLVLSGDRLRLRAVVERIARVVAPERSDAGLRLVVREDLAPILLDEVLEGPRFF